jgi:transcriptional regulator with XRE-family HTH domain
MSAVDIERGEPAEGGRMKVRDAATIRRVRELRGLSQRELAYLCRPCSQTTIYLLETGRMRSLSPQLAVRIAKRLDADVLDLFAERR